MGVVSNLSIVTSRGVVTGMLPRPVSAEIRREARCGTSGCEARPGGGGPLMISRRRGPYLRATAGVAPGPGLSSESPGIRPAPAPGSLPYQQGESLHPGGRRLGPTRRPAGPSAGQLPVDRRREFRRRRAARVDPVSNGPGAVPTRRTISCLHGPMKCDLYFI